MSHNFQTACCGRHSHLPGLAALVLLIGNVASAQEKILRWHDNLDRGAAAARQTGKPLFVVFRCVR